jgi:hypothetical protein
MDYNLLNKIRADTLAVPLVKKPYSEEFAGLIVDGRNNVTLDSINPAIHSFRVYSKNEYPIILLLGYGTPQRELQIIQNSYSNILVYLIPPLDSILLYSEFMFNQCFRAIPEKFEKLLLLQSDGHLIQSGWEDFVNKGNYDYIGGKWRSDIEILNTMVVTTNRRFANGGASFRRRSSMIKLVNEVNKRGGQHSVFKGIKINGQLMQNNSWLAEDSMFSIGFDLGIFKPITEFEADVFSHEPIEFSLFKDKGNINRPHLFHKVDR